MTVDKDVNEEMRQESCHSSDTSTESFKAVEFEFAAEIPTKKTTWRKGKWTDEEETYTMKLIEAFIAGVLPLAAGTTLRSFLSDKLCCDPMRITKKFAGSNGIGKQIFHPCLCNEKTDEIRSKFFSEISDLENILYNKVQKGRSVSFPSSAKALAFSAKLQLQVQQAPLLTQDYAASRVISGLRGVLASQPWQSRFDSSNTTSITSDMPRGNDTAHTVNIGEKRLLESDSSSGPSKRPLCMLSSDLDASTLLMNFFNAIRDSSDPDSDSNESIEDTCDPMSPKRKGIFDSVLSTTQLPYYANSGHTTAASSSSDSDDQADGRKTKTAAPTVLIPC